MRRDLGRSEPVAAGTYYLVNVVDPLGLLLESDPNLMHNAGVVSIDIPARIGTNELPQPTPTSSIIPTPSRTRRPHPPHLPRAPRPGRTPIPR